MTGTLTLTKLQHAIVDYLRSNPGPHTALDIQFEVLGHSTDTTCRRIRREIRRLNEKGYPIVSSGEGFRLARTWHAVGEYRSNLVQRAARIMERIAALDSFMANGHSTPVTDPNAVVA